MYSNLILLIIILQNKTVIINYCLTGYLKYSYRIKIEKQVLFTCSLIVVKYSITLCFVTKLFWFKRRIQ